MNERLKTPVNDQLFRAISKLEGRDEYYAFFEDVCSIAELQSLAQRLEIARLLDEGHVYEDIVARTGASTATISRIKRCLLYGADGYRIALSRLKDDN